LTEVRCRGTKVTDASCLSHIKGLTVYLVNGKKAQF